MKKSFLLLAAAAMMAACSESDLTQEVASQKKAESGSVLFDVYSHRNLTRGGQAGDLNNKNIGTTGFGVFAYYTDGDIYTPSAKPDFMYNQKVWMADPSAEATLGNTQWIYEPVKYWPNEYGSAAINDGIDRVSFFAYAPWTLFEPTTGAIVTDDESAESVEHQQNYNIIGSNRNTDLGDPVVKYRVDTDPATSVDLLWGVASPLANDAYGPIDGPVGSQKDNADVTIKVGEPFLNLVKPNDPANDKLLFNLKHALAKVKITVDYIDDAETPAGPAAQKMDAASTRIFVREFKISGWALEGALNLNNEGMPGEPNWKALDGKSELAFDDELTFFDGRKDPDGEGKKSGEAKSEKPQGLNPLIVENYDSTETVGSFGTKKNPGVAAMTKDDEGNITVTVKPVEQSFERSGKTMNALVGTQLLFSGDPTKNDGFFYVIPRNSESEGVNVEIAYDVETIDAKLASTISDGLNHGLSVANVIRKLNIFGEGIDFKPGYQYVINLHLGMTSVKLEADVQPWIEVSEVDVDLPDNQDPANEDGSGEGDNPSAVRTLAEATTGDEGMVVCEAGHLHEAKTAVPDGCTAAGILGEVTETGHGLILALQNAAMQTWTTINGWASVDTYAGTTLKLLPDDAARGNLPSYTELGSTTVSNWAVAQMADYQTIFQNLGSNKSDGEGYSYDDNVNAYITEAGGTALSGDYWSAQRGYKFDTWDMYHDYWVIIGNDNENFRVRPVLGF